MERMPQCGERYRQQDGGLYQVITVAVHAETGERLVVYQALYGDYGVYVGPLSLFMDEADRTRYPKAAQRYRFERVKKPMPGTAREGGVARHLPPASGRSGMEREEASGAARAAREADGMRRMAMPTERGNGTPQDGMGLREREGGWRQDGAGLQGQENGASQDVNSKMMDFFDADSLEEKYNILLSMRGEITDHMINNMAVVLDVVIPEGDTDDRYEALKHCIRTKQRYEIERLR